MAKRNKEWARKARTALLSELGNCCAECGTDQKLTFDCKVPCGDRHHKMDTSARMCFYRAQHKLGNLQILCKYHNDRKDSRTPF